MIRPAVSPITRVSLECIDDDRLGESHDVIWEREIQPKIIEQVYSLRSIRMFPLAVEFILPFSMEGIQS